MFGKEKRYRRVSFPPDVLEAAINEFAQIIIGYGEELSAPSFSFGSGDEETSIDRPEAHHRSVGFYENYFYYRTGSDTTGRSFILTKHNNDLSVHIRQMKSLDDAQKLLHILDSNYTKYALPKEDALKNITVFLGHGRSRLWRDLKDHLQDKHGITVAAYETGARGGFTIQQVLEKLSSEASIAFLVHTGEDIDSAGDAHARENVVHETGLLQGRLGFTRAVVLLEDGCNEFSNIAGLQQIRFATGNIKETFGEVLAILRREFTSPA